MKVEILQASQCALTGKEITTYVLEYPATIHAQLLTHRVFSKNTSSTRAIPIQKSIAQLRANPAKPIFTHKQSGMQGDIVEEKGLLSIANELHQEGMEKAIELATEFDDLGIHKQNAGRYLYPFQNLKVILTTTETLNWDWLRIDADAQPEIEKLARLMEFARLAAHYEVLEAGEYHLPYILRKRDEKGQLCYYHPETLKQLPLHEAIELSIFACAQISYRNLNLTDEAKQRILPKLFKGKKIHASPTEHQATPFNRDLHELAQVKPVAAIAEALSFAGATGVHRTGQIISGNFLNWAQQRQKIPNHDRALMETL